MSSLLGKLDDVVPTTRLRVNPIDLITDKLGAPDCVAPVSRNLPIHLTLGYIRTQSAAAARVTAATSLVVSNHESASSTITDDRICHYTPTASSERVSEHRRPRR